MKCKVDQITPQYQMEPQRQQAQQRQRPEEMAEMKEMGTKLKEEMAACQAQRQQT
jgi:hypothetical protein